MALHVVDHPLVRHKIGILRKHDISTSRRITSYNVCYTKLLRLGYPQYRFQRLVERNEPAVTWRM